MTADSVNPQFALTVAGNDFSLDMEGAWLSPRTEWDCYSGCSPSIVTDLSIHGTLEAYRASLTLNGTSYGAAAVGRDYIIVNSEPLNAGSAASVAFTISAWQFTMLAAPLGSTAPQVVLDDLSLQGSGVATAAWNAWTDGSGRFSYRSATYTFTSDAQANAINSPEPGTFALVGVALAAASLCRLRRPIAA